MGEEKNKQARLRAGKMAKALQERERLDQLQARPGRCRIGRHIEVEDPSSVER